jgi:hypothetical protein
MSPNSEECNIEKLPKTIFKFGGIAALLSALSIAFAIVAYFIWPYKGNTSSIEDILTVLQTDRIGGLIALDISMLIIGPFTMLMFVALYIVLRRVNEPVALVALIMNMMAIVLVIICRPLVEFVMLSNQFALATEAVEKSRILAAGELLRLQLDGTAWTMQTAFLMIAGLINNTLMLRTVYFKKRTAWTGIVISAIGLPFFLPEIGLIFLFFNTIGSIPWCIFVAGDLLRISRAVSIQNK